MELSASRSLTHFREACCICKNLKTGFKKLLNGSLWGPAGFGTIVLQFFTSYVCKYVEFCFAVVVSSVV